MPEIIDPDKYMDERQRRLNRIASDERDDVQNTLDRMEAQRRKADPYAEIYRDRRARTAEPKQHNYDGMSLLERTIRDDRDNQLRIGIMSAPAPDQIARETRVARAAGQPPALVGDVDYAEKAVNANRLTQVFGQYPALGRWGATNLRGAATAQDDHVAVGALGKAWETVKSIPAALDAGMQGAAAGLSDFYLSVDEVILPYTDPSRARERLDQRRAEAETYRLRQQAVRPKGAGFVSESALQGLESLPLSMAALAVGALTRSPVAAATTMGVPVGATAYQESLREGRGTAASLRHGIIHGGSEAFFEAGPAQTLLSMSGRPMVKATAEFLAREVPGELGTMLVQSFADWVNLNPDKPYAQWVAGLPEESARTVIATLSGGGAQVGAVKLAGLATASTAKMAGRVAQAARARQEAKALDALAKGAIASKFRTRDPEGFTGMIGAMSEETGATHMYVSGAVSCDYMAARS